MMSAVLPSSYDGTLVVLSIVIAMLASFTALDLAGRVTLAKRALRAAWIGGGGIAMGVGIWSMHYIGMLAFHLPVEVRYDVPLVALSLVAAILASIVALLVVSRSSMSAVRLAAGAVVMGAGIAAMHYTGMAAMRLPAAMSYDAALVALSIVVAIVVSGAALAIAFRLRLDHGRAWLVRKLFGAVIMGLAISSMHYIGMAAARFAPGAHLAASDTAVHIGPLGVVAIAGTACFVLAFALLTGMMDRQLALNTAALLRSEGERRRQQRFLRDVIDADPHLVFAKDADGIFTLANRATAEVFGTTPAALVGTDGLGTGRHPGEIAAARGIDLAVIRSGKATVIPEVKVRVTADVSRWYQAITLPLDVGDEKERHALTIATDISQLKTLEEQLRHAQKMEAVGRLAGGIAHDFNNLITVVAGHAELLFEDLPEDGPYHQDVEGIRAAARRAAGLTQQLLAFSRRQVLQPRLLDLNDLVGGTAEMLRRLMGSDVRFVFEPSTPLGAVRADPGQLEQVLMNLAVNARDAMPQGGSLTISTIEVTIDEAFARANLGMQPGAYVRLTVSDTGEGMDATTRAHLFEPFFTTKGPGKGTGLGLATAYGIIKQSEGYITVESERGAGTTFRIFLPRVADTPAPTAPTPTTRVRTEATETILLVEDDDAVRRLTRSMLDRLGYRVFEASDGRQALALAAALDGEIDLLLTDLIMPRMGGRELSERLTALRPSTRILFVSGYTNDTLVQLSIDESAAAFLRKPFSLNELADRIRTVLAR